MEWPAGATMIYPETIRIHRDHKTGDAATNQVQKVELHHVNTADFILKHYDRAIGGVQIVRGEFARAHGYLGTDAKYQKAAKKILGDFRDDIAYRNFCRSKGKIVPVSLPGVYRIRHSQTSYQ